MMVIIFFTIQQTTTIVELLKGHKRQSSYDANRKYTFLLFNFYFFEEEQLIQLLHLYIIYCYCIYFNELLSIPRILLNYIKLIYKNKSDYFRAP